jgi:regulator of sirC expression with transglutaminase-like and TPR domain
MGRLDHAALEIASIEHSDVDVGHWLGVLDQHAGELGRRVSMGASGDEFIDAAGQYLFHELGFSGNAANYFDPCNSCLNDVLAARTGIPITLSVVYMEIARRLARPVYGVGLPGHFIVLYDDGETSAYLDPFHGGVRRSMEECYALARQATGTQVAADPALLAAVTHRQIVQRMLNNLLTVYLHRRNYPRALKVLEFLLEAHPASPDIYKQRGMVHGQLGNFSAARSDLARCLELAPETPDRQEIESTLQSIIERLARMN